jgi:hypothetical protein
MQGYPSFIIIIIIIIIIIDNQIVPSISQCAGIQINN